MLECTYPPTNWGSGGNSRVTTGIGDGSGLRRRCPELSQVVVVAIEKSINNAEPNPIIGHSKELDVDVRYEVMEVEDCVSIFHQVDLPNMSHY